MAEAYMNGEEKGIKEGIKEGEVTKTIEIAKNLLKMNMPIEDIIKATNLSKKEIEALKADVF